MPAPATATQKKVKELIVFQTQMKSAEDDGETGKIAGFVSAFGNIDYGLDIVHPGAFTATIKAKKGVFPFLLDHNRYEPAGFSTRMEEQAKGLYYEAEMPLCDPRVKQRYELCKLALKLGTSVGNSFGYIPIKYDFEERDTEYGRVMVRNLREVMLKEGSLVTFPMNDEAGVTDAKAEQCQELLAILQNGTYSEEVRMQKALAVFAKKQQAAYDEIDPELLQSVEAFKGIFRS